LGPWLFCLPPWPWGRIPARFACRPADAGDRVFIRCAAKALGKRLLASGQHHRQQDKTKELNLAGFHARHLLCNARKGPYQAVKAYG
jgi:hypothetical protein